MFGSKQLQDDNDCIVTSIRITKAQYKYAKNNYANLSWIMRKMLDDMIKRENANEVTPLTESSFIFKDEHLGKPARTPEPIEQ